MVTVTVLKAFYDLVEKVDRLPGDSFEATEDRAEHIDSVIPGYVTYAKAEPEEVDLSKMKVAQLKALCADKGVEVPSGATKAQLIALLEE